MNRRDGQSIRVAPALARALISIIMLHVSGLRFVNALGVVVEDPLQSNFLGQFDGVRGLALVTGTGGGLTQTPARGEVGGGAGRR